MTTQYGFELLREQELAEIKSKAHLYRHIKTGAQLLSLQNDDENKSFGIAFRTPVGDSTGVAHILEHAVLCGSRKYPLKDPFIELAKGSLNTFLNAFTSPDKTTYPIASQNLQDFYNLIDVYLDTVFYPRLSLETFQEQGWHYEIDAPDDPLTYKGVVFNEMKGAYASPDRVLYKQVQYSLFPDTIYSADSGGDPRHIPDLTYEHLKNFHRTYYHPSNSMIFMYGDDDPEARLRLLDAYLSDFEPLAVDAVVPLQSAFEAPRRIASTFAANAEHAEGDIGKAMVSVNWMLPAIDDAQTTLALGILERILVGTPAAPLRRALIDSGLGQDLTSSGLVEDLRQMVFMAGLKGIGAEQAGKVEDLILSTFGRLADDGIDPDTIEAAMNTVEFALRENNTGSFPRGLSLMMRSLSTWTYYGDPFAPLAYEAPLTSIKEALATGEYFEGLIRTYLLNNSHRTTVVLSPDAELDRRETEAERARLNQARSQMSAEEVQAAVQNTHRLRALQGVPDSQEVLATLPALARADLEPKVKTVPIEVLTFAETPVLYHDLFTNGIIYLDVALDLRALPQELLPYVSLFGRALQEMGTETEDFVRLTQRIGQKTGGIGQSVLLTTVERTRKGVCRLVLRGKAMPDQADDLLAILRDMLLKVRFDNQPRFKQMAQEEKARLEARIGPSGSAYVGRRLRAHFDLSDWAGEQMGGISYLFFLRELLPRIDSDWAEVLAKLEQIRALVVNRAGMLGNVTVNAANWERFAPKLAEFFASIPLAPLVIPTWNTHQELKREGLTVSGQVNYVGLAANLYALGYRYDGSAMVALNYLNTSWLWEKVRKEGGAYGVHCSLDRLGGVLCFTSYRDPNLRGTLQIFAESGRFLRDVDLSESELTRTIVGVIGDLDGYQLPDAKGYSSLVRYLCGISDESRQAIRNQVLATTVDHVRAFGTLLDQVGAQGLAGVVGPIANIEAANREVPDLFEIVKVL